MKKSRKISLNASGHVRIYSLMLEYGNGLRPPKEPISNTS